MRRVFQVLTLASFGFGSAAASAQSPPSPAKPPAVGRYDLYTQRVLSAADLMPAEAYDSRLAPGVRSFGEAVGHSIDTNFGVCAGARRLESPKKGINHEQSIHGKAELVAALREAVAYCSAFVAQAAAAGTHESDLAFLNTHNAQMLVLMEAQLIGRGLTPAKATEAAAPVKKQPPAE
jgi:hypothetical protein